MLIDLAKPGPLQDARVRCAMSMAIDRDEVNDLTVGRHPDRSPTACSRPASRATSTTTASTRPRTSTRPRQLIDDYKSSTGATSIDVHLGSTADRDHPAGGRAAPGLLEADRGQRDPSTPCRRTSSSPTPCSACPTSRSTGGATTPACSSTSRTSGGTAHRAPPDGAAVAELRPAQRPDGRRRPGHGPQRPGSGQAQGRRRGHQPDDGQELLPDPDHVDAVGHAAQAERARASARRCCPTAPAPRTAPASPVSSG